MTAKPERDNQSERNGDGEGGAVRKGKAGVSRRDHALNWSRGRGPEVQALEQAAKRALREGLYGPNYRRVEGSACVYCGQPATGVDHVPPLARVAWSRGVPWRLYPACGGCNVVLAVYRGLCLADRAEQLALRLYGLDRLRAKRARGAPLGAFLSRELKAEAVRAEALAEVRAAVCECPACVAGRARSGNRAESEVKRCGS